MFHLGTALGLQKRRRYSSFLIRLRLSSSSLKPKMSRTKPFASKFPAPPTASPSPWVARWYSAKVTISLFNALGFLWFCMLMILYSLDSDSSFNMLFLSRCTKMEGKRLYYLDGGGEWVVVEALRRLDGEEAVTWTCLDSWYFVLLLIFLVAWVALDNIGSVHFFISFSLVSVALYACLVYCMIFNDEPLLVLRTSLELDPVSLLFFFLLVAFCMLGLCSIFACWYWVALLLFAQWWRFFWGLRVVSFLGCPVCLDMALAYWFLVLTGWSFIGELELWLDSRFDRVLFVGFFNLTWLLVKAGHDYWWLMIYGLTWLSRMMCLR